VWGCIEKSTIIVKSSDMAKFEKGHKKKGG